MKAFKRLLAAAMAVNMLSNYSPALLVLADGEETETPDAVEEAPAYEEAPQEVYEEPVYEEPAPAPEPEPVYVEPEPAPEPEPEPVYTEPEPEPVYEETPAPEETVTEASEQEAAPEAEEPKEEESAPAEENKPEERTLTFEVVDGFGYVVETNGTVTDADARVTSISKTVRYSSEFTTVWAIPADGYEIDYWELDGARYAGAERVKIEAYEINLDQDHRYVVHFRKQAVVEEEEQRLEEVAEVNSRKLTATKPNNLLAKDTPEGEEITDDDNYDEEPTRGDTATDPESDVYVVTFVDGTGEDAEVVETKYIPKPEEGENPPTVGALPVGPSKAGAVFRGWFVGEDEITAETPVTGDMTVVATFQNLAIAHFISDGQEVQTVEVPLGDLVGALPQQPFKEGYTFDKWVVRGTETQVTADTVVSEPEMFVEALFTKINVYTLTINYFYRVEGREDPVVFDTDVYQFDDDELPYSVDTPPSTRAEEVSEENPPTYYTTQPTVTVDEDDFDENNNAVVDVEYVDHTAKYYFVYLLKDLEGDGYTEIERTEEKGVLYSTVTPTVNSYDYAEFEWTEPVNIIQESGQELPVKYTRKTFNVTFNTNGGSYVNAISAVYGQTVTLSNEPTKTGYTFAGWYLDADCTQAASTSFTVEKDTTLYAKWQGAPVNYTIVYMFEKYNDAGTETSYVYDNSETGTATVGTTVRATDSSIPDKTRAGWEKDSTRNATSSVEIKADGSSVLYVYYKLIEYTFYFEAGSWGLYTVEATLVGKNVSGEGRLNYTMKVKLGQDISTTWPYNVTGEYGVWWRRNVGFEGWLPAGGSQTFATKRLIVTTDMLPSSGNSIVYTAQWVKWGDTYEVNYYLQNADDDGYTWSELYSQTYYSNSGGLDHKDIAGYEYHHSSPSGSRNFYYNRLSYDIDYFDGSDNILSKKGIKFEADITDGSFNWVPNKPEGKEDYTWGGWYSDSALQTQYTFGKMPSHNLVLYAKWIAPEFTVTFDTQGGSPDFDSVTVSKNDSVSFPGEPTKDNYVFNGWWTDAEGGQLYDWNYKITNNTTIYAHWKQKTLSYTVKYVDENDEPLLDDKVIENPALELGQVITENALTITGYRPDAASKSIELDFGTNEIKFVYCKKVDETKYVVNYVIQGTNYKVHESKTVTVSGNQVIAEESAVSPNKSWMAEQGYPEDILNEDYYPLDDVLKLTLTTTEESNVITFEYVNYLTAKITVKYVDMTGEPITGVESVEEHERVGQTYQVDRKSISGYTYDYTDHEEIFRVVNSDEIEIKVYYKRHLTIVANNKSKPYDGTALVSEGVGDLANIEGLAPGDSVTSIEYTGSQTDAGTHSTTPRNAVISGTHDTNYYSITYVPGSLTVTPIAVTVTVDPDRWTGNIYTGKVYEAGFTNTNKTKEDYVSINNESYKEKYLDTIWNSLTSPSKTLISETDAGYYTVSAAEIETRISKPADSNYTVTWMVRDAELEIKPVTLLVTTGSDSKKYDGTELTNSTATLTGLIEGETATVVATGSRTEVGSSPNTYEITWGTAKSKNYTITEDLGTLLVEANDSEVKLIAPSDSKTYDGTPLTCDGSGEKKVTATGLPNGFTIEATATGSATNVGDEGKNVVDDGFVIKNAAGEDKTANFTNVTKVDGTLTIKPKPVTVKADNKTKTYGEPDPELTATVTGTLGEDRRHGRI